MSSGIQVFKLWFTVSQARQKQRFDDRRDDLLKQWKLSPIDEVSVQKYDEYTDARNEMLLASDTMVAPWTIVNSNDKKRARLGAIHSVLHALDYEHKNHDVVGDPDPRGGSSRPFGVHRQLSAATSDSPESCGVLPRPTAESIEFEAVRLDQ